MKIEMYIWNVMKIVFDYNFDCLNTLSKEIKNMYYI